jgi:hypothetical protein
VSYQTSFFRIAAVCAAASLLAACNGGSAAPPPMPQVGNAAQSAARSAQSAAHGNDSHAKPPSLSASPASLEFTADQAAAGTAQTVTVSALDDGRLNVSIAGTGNCPLVTPSKLKPKHVDDDGDAKNRGRDATGGVITVTPNGAGPATCAITVSNNDGDDRDGDRGHDGDRDHHDGDHHGDRDGDHQGRVLVIPVVVDAPVPVASPTPVPCGARGC